MLRSHAALTLTDGGTWSLTSDTSFTLMVLCIFMLGWGPTLSRGVIGAGFGNLVFYSLGVGKWVLLQAEDEIRLCQKRCLPASYPHRWRLIAAEGTNIPSLLPALSSIDFPCCCFHYFWLFLFYPDFHVLEPYPCTLDFTHLHYAAMKLDFSFGFHCNRSSFQCMDSL